MINLIQNETITQIKGENCLLQFIKYGDTELVYVLIVDNKKYTILINQPHNDLNIVKKEYENLIKNTLHHHFFKQKTMKQIKNFMLHNIFINHVVLVLIKIGVNGLLNQSIIFKEKSSTLA